jgi:cellulose biosynthesis protein BcsQ/tetratricopeptide (TPR) repeat protein
MSYFVTFYSYKGGVGRTLALANVAWLLANHRTEPARVLAIDFDLGAPGLSQVFGIKRATKSPGIVDYVTEYLTKAEIPDVTKFIHKTTFKNIDLLPAGQLGSTYQRRLEAIDWKRMYEEAYGYELIERLKADISAIIPEYDYVLVDSLTGYSDIGGICVNQFPDTIILLFRLNQQNLDGIGNVYRALKLRNEDELARSVLPVITPSWPFLDEAAGKWISKAEQLFQGNKLLEISFDSSLSFGESIISATASNHHFASKVLADYESLADQIRERNSSDPLTIWKAICSPNSNLFAEPAEAYLRLLLSRPNVLEYWNSLSMAFRSPWSTGDNKHKSQAVDKLLAFVNQEADGGNKYALFGRARIRPEMDNNWRNASQDDLNKALKIDPNFIEALVDRGLLSLYSGGYEEAIADFNASLKLRSRADLGVEFPLAQAYLRLFRAREALDTVQSGIARNPKNLNLYLIRAKALYLLGDYPAALMDARKSVRARASFASLPESFLPSQILAAMGRIDEATILTQLAEQSESPSRGNLAEAYLAVDPEMTITLLSKEGADPDPAIRELLMILARIFRGDDVTAIESDIAAPMGKKLSGNEWDVFEITAMLRAKERSGALSPKAFQLACQAVRKYVEEDELAGLPPG